MALSKINLVRLKSGQANPSDGSLIAYESGAALYQTQSRSGFIYEISPSIKLSEANNDIGFITTSSIPLTAISVDGTLVGINDSVSDIGPHVLLPSEVYDGAYSQHWVSTNTPIEASGKDGDLWFVIA